MSKIKNVKNKNQHLRDLGLEFQKINVGIRIKILEIPILECANFQAKQTIFNFSARIFPKMELGLRIQKTYVERRISHKN